MDRPLNATAASLLGFLHRGPMTGWDLVVVAQESIGGFWSLTQSQVYRELAAMERDGLIRAEKTGPRERKPFSLTEAGRSAFAEWLDREPGPENIRYPLLLTMVFGEYLAPERLAEMLRDHQQMHERQLASYLETAASHELDGNRFALATLDFGIYYERAVIEWFNNLPARLTRNT
ncbi:PadR family transcriptional regulator [Antrihabitans stalactiti]|uniref:PadR family transcriptional regulator n=1 Tax=Antrihabitans stalactiti TaxID=2584121 RepID=A0A848KM62_9NOCA|nr:PadR family transcriptional regulator [Antrihabitans stalactiti]NMN98064.1 PadR family transcriptional regulator [Antrihabitans stalactiti]